MCLPFLFSLVAVLCVNMLPLTFRAVAGPCCDAAVDVCCTVFGLACCCGKRVLFRVVWCCRTLFMCCVSL